MHEIVTVPNPNSLYKLGIFSKAGILIIKGTSNTMYLRLYSITRVFRPQPKILGVVSFVFFTASAFVNFRLAVFFEIAVVFDSFSFPIKSCYKSKKPVENSITRILSATESCIAIDFVYYSVSAFVNFLLAVYIEDAVNCDSFIFTEKSC